METYDEGETCKNKGKQFVVMNLKRICSCPLLGALYRVSAQCLYVGSTTLLFYLSHQTADRDVQLELGKTGEWPVGRIGSKAELHLHIQF